MDHKSFETHMIDFVNRNAKVEEEARNERIREQREAAGHLKRKKATKAIIEYILWVAALVGIVYTMSFAYLTHYVAGNVAVYATSLFAFIAGLRINTLAHRISKYGGQA